MKPIDHANIDRTVKLAMLAAISVLLVLITHFPIFPAVSFLEYDMADVPILIGTFLYGPVWGLALLVVASIIQGLTVSAQSGLMGILMHIIATGAFVVVAGIIYRGQRRTIGYAILALAMGTLAMAAIMIPFNYFLTPLFISSEDFPYSAAQSRVWGLMPYIIAFNLIKAGANSILTFLLYKATGKLLRLRIVK